ncbi:MAG: hypothetical protein EOO74_08940 [Myxococcales bacterium]|nr:MAG: hypothetical protein EOO74_08940 [Myxococcales bacterium]
MSDAYTELAAALALDEATLPGIAATDDGTLAVIHEAYDRLCDEEDRAVADGIQSAVRIVPRPLRAVARNLLFGEDR